MAFIIAMDYDGTIVEGGAYPEEGTPQKEMVDKIKEFKSHGAEILLWTCRGKEALEKAVKLCGREGIELDAINANSPSVDNSDSMDMGGVKIYADIYVDDRSPGSIEYFLGIDVKQTCDSYNSRERFN